MPHGSMPHGSMPHSSMPSSTMPHIRPALPADGQAIQRLFEQIISTAAWLPPLARTKTNFSQSSEGELVIISLSSRGHLQGLLSVWQEQSFIHHLYVAPEYRRQGVGTALLDSLKPWLPRPWQLKCIQANAAALAFYQARGWVIVGRGSGEQGDHLLLEYPFR